VGSIVKSDGSLLQLYRFQLRCGDCLRGRVMGAMKHLAADKRWEAGGSQYLTISRAPSSRDSHLFVAPARSTWRWASPARCNRWHFGLSKQKNNVRPSVHSETCTGTPVRDQVTALFLQTISQSSFWGLLWPMTHLLAHWLPQMALFHSQIVRWLVTPPLLCYTVRFLTNASLHLALEVLAGLGIFQNLRENW